jgi:glucosamine--fructose-6-phosphate aminotransferase (isomerizing)
MTQSDFAILQEMDDAINIIRNFDPKITASWQKQIAQRKKLLLTGEGSSRIFPARNLISQSLQHGTDWTIQSEGARQAATYNIDEFAVIGASNSGQTKELIALLTQLRDTHALCFGITAQAGSALTTHTTESLILSCGTEKAVAATKSVIEQALILQSLLPETDWSLQHKAADAIKDILSTDLPIAAIDQLAKATTLYFAGANDGVAEELTLKSYEITRKRAAYLEGTYILHGVEEIMQRDDALILIEPHRDDLEKIKTITQPIAIPVIAIATYDTGFPTLIVPSITGFNGYIRLCLGWRLLTAIGIRNHINLDKTERARKQGNAL